MRTELRPIWNWFQQRIRHNIKLALLIQIGQQGSSYKKTGAIMLADEHGEYTGLLSGGCLESHLANLAGECITHNMAQVVDIDPADPEFAIPETGCNGIIKVAIVPVYGALIEFLDPDRTANSYFIINHENGILSYQEDNESLWHCRLQETPFPACRVEVRTRPSLLILGAGADAPALLRQMDLLHWQCDIVDDRHAYLVKERFLHSRNLFPYSADELPDKINLASYQAAVIMTHKLELDTCYLDRIWPSPIPMVFLLGPPARRDRILRQLGIQHYESQPRLSAPAGIDLGGYGPEHIALSIAAEIVKRQHEN